MTDRVGTDLSPELIDELLAAGERPAPDGDSGPSVVSRYAAALADEAAAMPQTLKPAIVLGLGGSGLLAALFLRRLLDRFVTESGSSVAALQRAASIFVLGVDTWANPLLRRLGAGNWLVLPQNPIGVNDRILRLWDTNQHFRTAWPTVEGEPYLPGDFLNGAGQDRLKGHAAWVLSKFEGGQSISALVEAAVQQIQDVLGLAPLVADGAFEIPIYLPRGLGGGTGSGLGNAAAVELRQALSASCRLIAVDILPDAAELKVHRSEHPSLRANGAIALVEAERLMTGNHDLMPFFERDGIAGAILADESPYLYRYLFSAKNAKHLTMTVEGQTEALVAHCLAAQIFTSAADPVADPESQVRHALAALPEHLGRSCLYASAAVSEVTYRPRLVAGALAARFAASAVVERLTLDSVRRADAHALGRSAADAFMDEHRLSWKHRSLRVRLDTPLPGEPPLPPAPALAAGHPAWDAARVDDVPGVVAERVKVFDTWRDRRWRAAVDQRGAATLHALLGTPSRPLDGALAAAVDQLLAGADGWGLARLVGFLDHLGVRLGAEREALPRELDGPDWKREPGPGGLKDRVARRRAGVGGAVRGLQADFGPFGLFAAGAKRGFEAQWWNRFAGDERDLVRAQAALAVISALVVARDALASRLTELDGALGPAAKQLRATAGNLLQTRELGGVLEERVLEDEAIVVVAFAAETEAVRTAMPAFVERQLTGPGGVRDLLRAAISARQAGAVMRDGARALLDRAAADGAALFQPGAAALSVWDALRRELDCRLELRLIDEPLRRALLAVRDDGSGLEPGSEDRQCGARLVQAYAEEWIRICLNRAAPFWQLDANAPLETPLPLDRPYPLRLVAYEEARYTAFRAATGLADFLPRVVANLGVRPKDRPGPYAITIYAREVGVPLYYLDAAELTGPMVRDAAIVGRARPLFTDARFDPVLVEFDPPEPAAARLGYAVAAAVHFRVAAVDHAGVVTFNLNGHGAPALSSVAQAPNALAGDAALADRVIREVNRCFASLPEEGRRQTIFAIAHTAGAQAAAAATASRQPDRLWWEEAQRIGQRRARRGRYHIA